MENSATTADSKTWGSHWHLRVISPTDEFISVLEKNLQRLFDEGYIKYAGGNLEVDSKIHYHIAIGTSSSVRQTTLVNKLRFFKFGKRQGWEQYYLRPVYKDSTPYQNYVYCTKRGTKFAVGLEPAKYEVRTEIKAKDRDSLVIQWAKDQEFEKIERLFPGYWIKNGSRLKGLYMRQAPPVDQGVDHEKHLWIYGESGKGKTSIVEYLYPGHFRKRADNDWLGWDANHPAHKVVHLNDLDMAGLKSLGVQHLKELCDPQGFNANVKYAGGEIINPTKVIVTSNFSIADCFNPVAPGFAQQIAAIKRRFLEIEIGQFLMQQGLMLVSSAEVEFAKSTDLWDRYGYRCMFKKIEYAECTDYHWLGECEEPSDTETVVLEEDVEMEE